MTWNKTHLYDLARQGAGGEVVQRHLGAQAALEGTFDHASAVGDGGAGRFTRCRLDPRPLNACPGSLSVRPEAETRPIVRVR